MGHTRCTRLSGHGLTLATAVACRVLIAAKAKPDASFGSKAAADGTVLSYSAAMYNSIFLERLIFNGQPLVIFFQTAKYY